MGVLALGPSSVTALGGTLGVLGWSRRRAPAKRLLDQRVGWRCQVLMAAEVAAVVRLGQAGVALRPQTVPAWSGPGWARVHVLVSVAVLVRRCWSCCSLVYSLHCCCSVDPAELRMLGGASEAAWKLCC